MIASYHFAPTAALDGNLLAERTGHARIFVTGNTVIDAFLATERRVPTRPVPPALAGLDPAAADDLRHRAPAREPRAMGEIARAVNDCRISRAAANRVAGSPVTSSRTGRTRGRRRHAGDPAPPPLDYAATVAVVAASRFVLTDSGGLQEEAPTLGKPVLVMRRETERPEGLEAGTLRLIGAGYDAIVAETRRLLTDPAAYAEMARASNPYGDGRAAERIVAGLMEVLPGPVPDEFLGFAA